MFGNRTAPSVDEFASSDILVLAVESLAEENRIQHGIGFGKGGSAVSDTSALPDRKTEVRIKVVWIGAHSAIAEFSKLILSPLRSGKADTIFPERLEIGIPERRQQGPLRLELVLADFYLQSVLAHDRTSDMDIFAYNYALCQQYFHI